MAFEVKKEKKITISEARKILKKRGDLNELQRRTLDYASKFSSLDAKVAEKLTKDLVDKFGLDRGVAVQIINCMPGSVEEIRTFLGRETILPSATVKEILDLLSKHVKK